MTITHVPSLPIKNNSSSSYFSFDRDEPICGGSKRVYLGYFYPDHINPPLPIALAKPIFFPWELNEKSRKELKVRWDYELRQIEKVNSLFPHSQFFIQCLYVQRLEDEIIGLIFEKGICDLSDLKEEHQLTNPLTLHEYSVIDLKRFALSMATAVGMLHENGLLHRDIKLENFILTYSGDIKLTDFGFMIESAHSGSKAYSSTLVYCSPEEFLAIANKLGSMPEDYYMEYKDLWALGLSYLHLFSASDNFPTWIYEIEDKLWTDTDLPLIAARIRNMIKEYLTYHPHINYWGLLKFEADKRSAAFEAAERIFSELPS